VCVGGWGGGGVADAGGGGDQPAGTLRGYEVSNCVFVFFWGGGGICLACAHAVLGGQWEPLLAKKLRAAAGFGQILKEPVTSWWDRCWGGGCKSAGTLRVCDVSNCVFVFLGGGDSLTSAHVVLGGQ
jgi:hypothetical protein